MRMNLFLFLVVALALSCDDSSSSHLGKLGATPRPGPSQGLPSQTGHAGHYLTTNGTGASWGPVAVPQIEVMFSPVNYGQSAGTSGSGLALNDSAGSGAGQLGTSFFLTANCTLKGIAGYWGINDTKNLKLSVWDVASTTRLGSVTIAVTGPTRYSGILASSLPLTGGPLYAVTAYETTGSEYTFFHAAAGFQAANVQFGGPHLEWNSWGIYETTDVFPDRSASIERYPVEPIIECP